MHASPSAPVTILRGRRPQDIEVVLRFDPTAPLARTEIEVESEALLSAGDYLDTVCDAAARLALYAGDYRAAMDADRSADDCSLRRQPARGAWTLRTLQDGVLALLDHNDHVTVTAGHGPSQERLWRLFGRISARTGTAH